MKKYYPYSVKDTLIKYFGADSVKAMRFGEWKSDDEKDILPLSWRYTDEMVCDHCLGQYFLMDTELFDDYIAYIVQHKDRMRVFLAFMHYEKGEPFDLDAEYAYKLIEEWREKGFDATIIRSCIGIEQQRNGYRFVTHLLKDYGEEFLTVERINGKYIFVSVWHPFWKELYKKFFHAIGSCDIRECEYLFADDITVKRLTAPYYREIDRDSAPCEIVASGVLPVKEYMQNLQLSLGYIRAGKNPVYDMSIIGEDVRLVISVNHNNLISGITIEKIIKPNYPIRIKEKGFNPLAQIPKLVAARVLSPKEMHAFALQLKYSNGSVRNYYLHTFSEIEQPKTVEIDGYIFTEVVLFSVEIRDGGIGFSNGYTVPLHILYSRSYPQLVAEKLGDIMYSDAEFTLKREYRIPLEMGWRNGNRYFGQHGEYFGPAKAFLDQQGNRISDVSFYHKDTGDVNLGVFVVTAEPSYKKGYMRNDGTWLVPPIFDEAKPFPDDDSCAVACIGEKEEKRQFLITQKGKVVPFDYRLGGAFSGGLCAFDIGAEKKEYPLPGEHFGDLSAGCYGYVNSDGKVVIEPQYVYATSFYLGDGKYAYAAKEINGVLRWGTVDKEGKPLIPFEYSCLCSRWGPDIQFMREGDYSYGLLDSEGNVILEPMFGYIEAYDEEHRLVSAGDDGDSLGVYSIDKKEMIVPPKYDSIDYGKTMISCELAYTVQDEYYDYCGNKLDFGEYDRVYEIDDGLGVWKDGRNGLIDFEGRVIIPPILSNGSYKNEYLRGFVVTGKEKKEPLGLKTLSGEIIVPEEYSDIRIFDHYIKAMRKNSTNWHIYDHLFTLDGKPLLGGPYRSAYCESKKNTFAIETPLGKEYYTILKNTEEE